LLNVLANRTYRHLFLAQVIALIGTGLATVALSLLAYDLAGANAGAVLGTALAIKVIAYVGVAPIAAAFAERLPRRTKLVAQDRGSCCFSAVRYADMGDLRPHLCSAVSICRLHADVSGHYPRRAA
jgi:MFS family permease